MSPEKKRKLALDQQQQQVRAREPVLVSALAFAAGSDARRATVGGAEEVAVARFTRGIATILKQKVIEVTRSLTCCGIQSLFKLRKLNKRKK